jgi:hypothetical protein
MWQYDARPHMAVAVPDPMYRWEVIPQSPYSPDMNPPDNNLFPNLKAPFHRKHLMGTEEVSSKVTSYQTHQKKKVH